MVVYLIKCLNYNSKKFKLRSRETKKNVSHLKTFLRMKFIFYLNFKLKTLIAQSRKI